MDKDADYNAANPDCFEPEKYHRFSTIGFVEGGHHNFNAYIWDMTADEKNRDAAIELSKHLQSYFAEWHHGTPVPPEMPHAVIFAYLSLNQDDPDFQDMPWMGTLYILDADYKEYLWFVGEGGPKQFVEKHKRQDEISEKPIQVHFPGTTLDLTSKGIEVKKKDT